MQNKLKTTLALLFAGIINLHAQAPEPTANEEAWNALIVAQLEAGATGRETAQNAAGATPEAIALKTTIMAGDTLTLTELGAVGRVTIVNEGKEARETLFRAIGASTKTGKGVSRARAQVKAWDRDLTGWTDEMIEVAPDKAAMLAREASPEFQLRVWNIIKEKPAHSARLFFKTYRSTLPKAEQVAVTQRQKDLIIAIPQRDAAANAWLAEIAADLVALQLDQ